MESGASGGKTKGGKTVMLSRKEVQALGGGNWAKGKGMLNSGEVTGKQVAAAEIRAGKTGESSVGEGRTAAQVRESRSMVDDARNTMRQQQSASRQEQLSRNSGYVRASRGASRTAQNNVRGIVNNLRDRWAIRNNRT